jgi:hypothetical protein
VPVGDPQGVAPQKLPFGHVEVIIPVEVPSDLGLNSEQRNGLMHFMNSVATGCDIQTTFLDDVPEGKLTGGKIQITARGLPKDVEYFRTRLQTIKLSDIQGSSAPRPYSGLQRRLRERTSETTETKEST